MFRIFTLVSLLVLTTACDYLPTIGGKLVGEATPVPADWKVAASPSVIKLETNPSEPYSVKLWIVGMGPVAYNHAGANLTTWVEHIEADPRVKILSEGKLYELKAERVTSQEEFDRMAEVYDAKYGNRPRNEDIEEIYLYRLVARD